MYTSHDVEDTTRALPDVVGLKGYRKVTRAGANIVYPFTFVVRRSMFELYRYSLNVSNTKTTNSRNFQEREKKRIYDIFARHLLRRN